jgi:hypothetical protein
MDDRLPLPLRRQTRDFATWHALDGCRKVLAGAARRLSRGRDAVTALAGTLVEEHVCPLEPAEWQRVPSFSKRVMPAATCRCPECGQVWLRCALDAPEDATALLEEPAEPISINDHMRLRPAT